MDRRGQSRETTTASQEGRRVERLAYLGVVEDQRMLRTTLDSLVRGAYWTDARTVRAGLDCKSRIFASPMSFSVQPETRIQGQRQVERKLSATTTSKRLDDCVSEERTRPPGLW